MFIVNAKIDEIVKSQNLMAKKKAPNPRRANF